MRPRGFSLLEVILAAIVFSFLSTALAAIWVAHARAQQKSANLLMAADLADQAMLTCQAQGFYGLDNSENTITQTWLSQGQTITQTFTIDLDIFNIIAPPGQPVQSRLAVVTVSYDGGDPTGIPSKFKLQEVIARVN